MNTLDYIRRYGKFTFDKKEFNEIDNIIFCLLSYVCYKGIVSTNTKNKMTIKQVRDFYYKMYDLSNINKEMLSVRNGVKILDEISRTTRYKDLLVYNYTYIGDNSQQFSAITFEINPKLVYVAFEGTDHLISGWEEDFKMTYLFPVNAHDDAIKYLNKNFSFRNCNIIVGGHSKGGNLALVSSMYCNFFVRKKIIKVYNNDGPGLRQKQLESKHYDHTQDKLIHIIPNYSIVGLFLKHTDDYKVIKSSRRGLFAHDAMTWQIDDDKFLITDLSKFSKVLEKGFLIWLDKYDDSKKKEFVDCIFEIFKKNNINSVIEIMESNKLILTLLKETINMDPIVKEMLKDLIVILRQCNKEEQTFLIDKNKKPN